MLPAELTAAKRRRRSRIYMVVTVVCIAAVMVFLYVSMKQITAQRMAQHKHSFMGYVTENHIGKLVEIDSGTGLDPMSYVLELSHPVADADKQSLLLQYMEKYVEDDRGTVLTVVYVHPDGHTQTPIGEAHYNPVDGRVSLSVHLDDGQTRSAVLRENW
ncbi:hypothetical protein GCM10025857_10380 [Alicyclobacillus contaminans]|uniref:hypothetical protein n=1 Tax=Alicyclobacillus contaminans TaxID=392016 RepID=UPI00041A2E06|nr:hypothetical protein [Alicyclobacillus contaminans]GMA49681.1 hypothetical protein GCM10025857_10380 [Alicyclobacillus contaminans]